MASPRSSSLPQDISSRRSATPALTAALLVLAGPGLTVAGTPESRRARAEAEQLVESVNALVPTDIPLIAAVSTPCTAGRLPTSRSALLPLLPGEHRELIEECARGRIRVRRAVTGFDLVGMIESALDEPAAEATVRHYLGGRAVDVATGRGWSDDPYPIGFDWVVVLETRSRTLFSFVVNCTD